MNIEFKDKRGREWETFIDPRSFDVFCVRVKEDRDFNSLTLFRFYTEDQALQFIELLKLSS
jgi:hypothetical protein